MTNNAPRATSWGHYTELKGRFQQQPGAPFLIHVIGLWGSKVRDITNHIVRGFEFEKLNIACQNVPLPKGFDMKNKLKPRIRSVYYWLKCCMEVRFWKMRKDCSMMSLSILWIIPNSPLLQAEGIPKSEFRILNLDYPLSFGSEISLSPSAIRLKEKTEKKKARPGKMESQGALVSWS